LYGYSPTLVVCDELAFWTTPSLRRAYAALTSGGGARSAPRTFTITTAGEASHRHDSLLGG
jgi:phage terminase large subunit-like protein